MHTSPIQSPRGHAIATALFFATLVVVMVSTYLMFFGPYLALGAVRSDALKSACASNAGCKKIVVVWRPKDGSVLKPQLAVLVQTQGEIKSRRAALEAIKRASASGESTPPVLEHQFKEL